LSSESFGMDRISDLFEPLWPNHLQMFARLFSAWLAIVLVLNFRRQYEYFRTKPDRIYGKPKNLLAAFLPVLTGQQFLLAGASLILCLAFIALGISQRFFTGIALVSYCIYFTPILSLDNVQRKINLPAFALLVLLFSPSLDKPLAGITTCWEIVLINAGIAQMYFSSGYQKLRKGGINWANGISLQAYLYENHLWSDSRQGLLIARSRRLCAVLSALVLAFELSFWIIIPFPSLTFLYVCLALLFHLGIYTTMRINYLSYLSPVYLVFLTESAFHIKSKIGF
jgi:hypothetical protein